MACQCIFRNEDSHKEIFFRDLYVRVKSSNPQLEPNHIPILQPGEDYDHSEAALNADKFLEVPKSVVATKTKDMATFSCEMDSDAVSLSWEFSSLLRDFKGAIIYQMKVGVSPYVADLYRVDTTQHRVYTLVVKRITPKTVGTYKCNLFYINKPTTSYAVQLVIANAEPMSVRVDNRGIKSKGLFKCVVEFFGKMQPFLKCSINIELFPVKLLTYKETFTKVLFQKELTYKELPFQCDVWFRDEDGASVLFQLGETKVQHMQIGAALVSNQMLLFHHFNPLIILLNFIVFSHFSNL